MCALGLGDSLASWEYTTTPIACQRHERQGIADLVEAARAVSGREAFGMVLRLARADQLCDQELALLQHLRRGLVTETVSG